MFYGVEMDKSSCIFHFTWIEEFGVAIKLTYGMGEYSIFNQDYGIKF